MPKRAAATAETPVGPRRWIEIELGDTDVTVDEHPDGMFVVRLAGGDEPLVVNAEQMQQIAGAFCALGKAKGWT